MARKRKKLKGLKEQKVKKLKDPDPTKEEFMYDEVDQFHRSKDKILLDPTNEIESDEEEIEDEEVLALGDSDADSDDMSDDDDAEDDDVDEDMSGDEELFEKENEDDIKSDKAWGRHKKMFYDADVLDEDVYASDEEAEQAAEDEEKEAMMLQKRMASNLDMEDFASFNDSYETDEENDTMAEETVQKDLSSLTKKEKLELLAKQSPELLPLIEDYKEKSTELYDKYQPLLSMCTKGMINSKEAVLFIEMRHQLLLSYLINISFYLVLKSSGENIKGHPIFDRLVQHKQLLKSTEKLDKDVIETFGDLLNEYKKGRSSSTKKASKKILSKTSKEKKNLPINGNDKSNGLKGIFSRAKNQDVDPLEYYDKIKKEKEEKKIAKSINNDINNEDVYMDDDIDEEGKRKITYQISKNKGLLRKRRKELKNPRVKHKVKFKKAKIKHKGQVAEVKREIQRYGGEMSGIKSNISKSVKIK